MELNEYSHKPKAKLLGSGPYCVGIELEVEAPDSRKRVEGLELSKRPRAFYSKMDGSLNEYGWELVSHPIGRDSWLEASPKKGPAKALFAMITELRRLGYTSHDGGRCGLHLHVCKKVFLRHRKPFRFWEGDKPTNHSPQLYWFSRLVNGKLFAQLSQREGSKEDPFEYCPQEKVTVKEFSKKSFYRRLALNLKPEFTVEVRIFRGNMREERIRKAVEAVIAAVEFSLAWDRRELPIQIWHRDLDAVFCQWVKAHRQTYPNLYGYLRSTGARMEPDPLVNPVPYNPEIPDPFEEEEEEIHHWTVADEDEAIRLNSVAAAEADAAYRAESTPPPIAPVEVFDFDPPEQREECWPEPLTNSVPLNRWTEADAREAALEEAWPLSIEGRY